MNKKSIKLFAVSALAFFASATLVNAKTYTSLDALTKDVETWRAKENEENSETKEDGFIYIIGKYVFTSNYDIKTWEDYATAFQTIPTSSKSYIFQIDRKYNGSEATGWDIEGKTNLFDNKAKLPENINIQYIDMELIDDAVDNDEAVKSIVDRANDAVKATENTSIYGAYILEIDPETGNISVSIKKGEVLIENVKNSGVVAELYGLLTSGNYSEIKITDLAENGKTISLKATDTTKTIKDALETLFTNKTNLENLVAQSYKIDFVIANGKVNSTEAERTSYTLNFNTIVDTDKLFVTTSNPEVATNNYVFSCKAVEGANCTPVINIVKAFTLAGQDNEQKATPTDYEKTEGIKEYLDSIVKMAKTTGVASVNVKIGSTNYTYTSKDVKKSLVRTDLNSALVKLTGKDVDELKLIDLLNTEITITINLDSTIAKSQNGKLSETYNVDIIANTNSNTTTADSVKDLNDIVKNVDNAGKFNYEVLYDNNSTITFRLTKNPSLVGLNTNSDLVDTLTDYYFSGLYSKVTVKNGTKSFELNSTTVPEGTDKGKIFLKYLRYMVDVAGLDSMVNASGAVDDSCKITADDIKDDTVFGTWYLTHQTCAFNLTKLVGKDMLVTLTPVNAGVHNEGTNSYTIKFVNSANTKTDLEKALDTVNSTAAHTAKVVEGKNVSEYTLDVNTSKLAAPLSEAERTSLQSVIQEVMATGVYKSITINVLGIDYEITYTNGDNVASYGKLNELMTILKETKVSVLRGSNITVTYVLADNVKNAEGAELKYTLVLTTVANTNSKVDTAVKANKEASFNIAFDAETRTLTFDLRKPYESVGNIVDAKKTNFANSITEVLATGLYKSLTISFDGEDFVVTYDATKKEITGFDALIDKIGRSTTLVQLAGKDVTMTFELADGVTDNVTTGKTVEYTIVLSNVVNSLDVVKDQILAEANKTADSVFRFIVDDNNNIQAQYAGDQKLAEVIQKHTGLLEVIKKTFANDERISSYTLKIGDTSITIDSETIEDMNKIKTSAIVALINSTKLLNTESKTIVVNEEDFDNGEYETDLANIQLETLATKIRETNTEISLSVNLVKGKAVNENNEITAEYKVLLSMYTPIDNKVVGIKVNDKAITVANHKAVISVTSGQDGNKENIVNFDITDLFTNQIKPANSYKFASVSFEIGSANIIINKTEFSNIETKKTEINNAIKALAGVTGNNQVKLGNLIGKEIKVTINLAENVVSEYGRRSETYTISFEAKEA